MSGTSTVSEIAPPVPEVDVFGAEGLDPAFLADARRRIRDTPELRPGRRGGICILPARPDLGVLAAAMDGRTDVFLEWPAAAVSLMHADPSARFVACLSAATVIGCPAAGILADAADRRGLLPAGRRADMETALHEALANAVLHGSTSGSAPADEDAEETVVRFARLMQAAADGALDHVPITVQMHRAGGRLTVAVRQRLRAPHPGRGAVEGGPDAVSYQGRGLDLVAALTDAAGFSTDGFAFEVVFTDTAEGPAVDAPILSSSERPAARIFESRVLVVDDAPLNCELISALLSNAGYSRIETAHDGVEALERIERGGIDLVILDLAMPRMDGFETARRIRRVPALRDLPILVETILDRPHQRAEAFAAGATDLVTKPINGEELAARVGIHLERRLLIRDLQAFSNRVSWELGVARRMQMDMVPTADRAADVFRPHGIDIALHFRPSTEIGGDVFDIRTDPAGRPVLLMVDFSGHGMVAAMNTFRLNVVTDQIWDDGIHRPDAFLAHLNRHLHRHLPIEHFATALCGRFDPVADMFRCGASSAPPILAISADGTPAVFPTRSVPLGVVADAQPDTVDVPFAPGGTVILCSDAFATAMGDVAANHDAAEILWERLVFAAAADGGGARGILDRILGAFRDAVGDRGEDDETLIVLCR